MSHAELIDAIWAAVPPGAEPARVALRRDWLLDHVHPGARILDLGCGEGGFTAALREHGAHPLGVDVAAEPIRRARRHWPGVDFRCVALEAPLALDDGSFDVVWAGEVIEHVVDVQGFLSEVRRVLPSGGSLLLTTPDVAAQLAAQPPLEELLDPRSDHLRFFTTASLREVVEAAGFGEIGIHAEHETLFLHATRSRF